VKSLSCLQAIVYERTQRGTTDKVPPHELLKNYNYLNLYYTKTIT